MYVPYKFLFVCLLTNIFTCKQPICKSAFIHRYVHTCDPKYGQHILGDIIIFDIIFPTLTLVSGCSYVSYHVTVTVVSNHKRLEMIALCNITTQEIKWGVIYFDLIWFGCGYLILKILLNVPQNHSRHATIHVAPLPL